MKKNVPKFVLARNEAAAPGHTYLVHTQEPSFIAEIIRFKTRGEKDEYAATHLEKEIIEVSYLVVIEVKKYLESPDHSSRRGFLNERMKHWVIANYLNKPRQDE